MPSMTKGTSSSLHNSFINRAQHALTMMIGMVARLWRKSVRMYRKTGPFLTECQRRYRLYRARAHQRRLLAQMPDYLLKDIGISRADALQECEKPFWKP